MTSSSAFALFLLLAPSAALGASLTSPNGSYRIEVNTGAKLKGSDSMPVSARITPAAGGTAVKVSFQLIRDTQPTDETLAEAFLWSPDESAVAVENSPAVTEGYGYRLVPLKAGLPWKMKNILGREGRWVDKNRLVYKGNGDDGYFIGIFDARSGRTRIAHDNLSSFTSYEITSFTPNAIHFREETESSNEDSCYSFNTNTGKRTTLKCPG